AVSAQRPLEWFDSFYREASGNAAFIPWADLEPNPNLVEWIEAQDQQQDGGSKILVVGCGLGDDAAYLARSGSSIVAFDISETAVQWARKRFGEQARGLDFMQADLLALPAEFERAFKLVVEIYTLQVLPEHLRSRALEELARCTGSRLLIICRGRDDDEPLGELPWGVSKRELAHLQTLGLQQESFEDYIDAHTGSRRFRAEYGRPQE
ncbi:MAG: class I SAM-dependent methyltransferase, partial [Candidatus Eremiobacteraeota bacterium]|nr:class I SAM-dependent methyltransferase [Candidatus Eremiobacteraeota bacterium]